MMNATCPKCCKVHKVDAKTYAAFGSATYCMTCVDSDHLHFMNTTGRRLGLSCVKGCPCAAKVKK